MSFGRYCSDTNPLITAALVGRSLPAPACSVALSRRLALACHRSLPVAGAPAGLGLPLASLRALTVGGYFQRRRMYRSCGSACSPQLGFSRRQRRKHRCQRGVVVASAAGFLTHTFFSFRGRQWYFFSRPGRSRRRDGIDFRHHLAIAPWHRFRSLRLLADHADCEVEPWFVVWRSQISFSVSLAVRVTGLGKSRGG